jgi:hypothetical protein
MDWENTDAIVSDSRVVLQITELFGNSEAKDGRR